MKNPNGRAHWSTKPDYNVECQDCGWSIHWAKTGLGLAARHHDSTGHVVRVEVGSTIYYGEDHPDDRRWWKEVKEGRS